MRRFAGQGGFVNVGAFARVGDAETVEELAAVAGARGEDECFCHNAGIVAGSPEAGERNSRRLPVNNVSFQGARSGPESFTEDDHVSYARYFRNRPHPPDRGGHA